MGMFDWVDYECECPVCGAKVTGFQTKELDCDMDTVTPQQALFFYSICSGCGAWLVAQYVEPVAAHIHIEASKKNGDRVLKNYAFKPAKPL